MVCVWFRKWLAGYNCHSIKKVICINVYIFDFKFWDLHISSPWQNEGILSHKNTPMSPRRTEWLTSYTLSSPNKFWDRRPFTGDCQTHRGHDGVCRNYSPRMWSSVLHTWIRPSLALHVMCNHEDNPCDMSGFQVQGGACRLAEITESFPRRLTSLCTYIHTMRHSIIDRALELTLVSDHCLLWYGS